MPAVSARNVSMLGLAMLGVSAVLAVGCTSQETVVPQATPTQPPVITVAPVTTSTTVAMTTTTLAAVDLDPYTLEWWTSKSIELQDLACGAGYDTVVYGDPLVQEATFVALCAGSQATGPARTGEPLTVAEFDAALSPAINAWARVASATTYSGIAAAAQTLIDSNRPFAADAPGDERLMLDLLGSLATYPGSDLLVAETIIRLAPTLPSAAPIVEDGTYRVGVDIQTGTYRTVMPVEGCYWETIDAEGDIIDNQSVFASPQVAATIRAVDFAFNSRSCGPWIRSS